ncbi:YopX family protein [Paenibacillus sp. B01]|uniref:YopX family protein n=1 Tax=Paenibacillus sp. B01 TaxID=2660554 RepID=UPI00129BE075|nr:YopX family protein [Paenibacillus sp. B01]QGG57895.1 hypothetical protein GE073_21540 [Paenibacillus sp. B01]
MNPQYKVLFNEKVYDYISHSDIAVTVKGGQTFEINDCRLLQNTGFKDSEGNPIFEGDLLQSIRNNKAACLTVERSDAPEDFGFKCVHYEISALGDINHPFSEIHDMSLQFWLNDDLYQMKVVGDFWSIYQAKANKIKYNVEAVKKTWEK